MHLKRFQHYLPCDIVNRSIVEINKASIMSSTFLNLFSLVQIWFSPCKCSQFISQIVAKYFGALKVFKNSQMLFNLFKNAFDAFYTMKFLFCFCLKVKIEHFSQFGIRIQLVETQYEMTLGISIRKIIFVQKVKNVIGA